VGIHARAFSQFVGNPVIFLEVNNLQASIPVMGWANVRDYVIFGLISAVLIPNNLYGITENGFGKAVECGLLLIHRAELATRESVLSVMSLPIIDLSDSLALLLLCEPLYFCDALEVISICKSLGLDATTPRVCELMAQVPEGDGQISNLNQLLKEKELERNQAKNTFNSIYQSTSWCITYTVRVIGTAHDFLIKISMKLVEVAVEFFKLSILHIETGLLKPSVFNKFSLLSRIANRQWMVKVFKMLLRGDFRNFILYAKSGINKVFTNNFAEETLELGDISNHFYKKEPKFNPSDQEIDIIIPIFNGMQFLPILFRSIILNTTSPYRLILVDDCSTDPEVLPLLEKIVEERPNTVLIRNEVNKGFVYSVNLGSQHAQNHFVLLNTDVEVPKFWLERLMGPILRDSVVASTTPFTNAGTICSFPKINEYNSIFAEQDFESVDKYFRWVKSENTRIELPTGADFCMGVNINVWKTIGPFDEKTFGRSYGEECDWCMRSSAVGYQNLMVPNLFIYQKYGEVFGEKKELPLKNLQKLRRRYPDYQRRMEEFLRHDPAAQIRMGLVLLLFSHYASKTVLIIDHDIGGGANTYRNRMIVEDLERNQAVLLLTRDPVLKALKLRCFFKDYEVAMLLSQPTQILELMEYVRYHEIFYNNLVSFEYPLDLVKLLSKIKKMTNVTLTVAIHDFFPLCPSYNLLNLHGRFCALPDLEECKLCLLNNDFAEPVGTSDITTWRTYWGELFSLANTVLCFSESTRKLIVQVYPLRVGQILLRPHFVPSIQGRKPRIDLSKALNIGVVGTINYAKGADIIIRMAKLLAVEHPDIRITVIGVLEDAPVLKNLTVTGRYHPNELTELIEKHCINMFFLPSICPETFSYVTSELIQLGLPLVCFDLGAPAERVRGYRSGRLAADITPEAALRAIFELKKMTLGQEGERRENLW